MTDVAITVYDGPAKGLTFTRDEADLVQFGQYDLASVAMDDGEVFPVTDPHFMVRDVNGVWSLMSWNAFQDLIRDRSVEDPDVDKLRASHDAMGGELLTVPCQPGQHDWPEWTETRTGSKVRRCSRCQVAVFKLW